MSSSVSEAEAEAEIWIIPFFGQGHLFPCIELCKQIAARNYKTTLIIPSHISSKIPSSLLQQYPLVQITEIPSSPSPPPQPPGSDPLPPHHVMHHHMLQGLRNLLSIRGPDDRPLCAIIDEMMGWTADVFKEFEVPMIGFFTSGACSAAMECAMWQARVQDMKPGEVRLLPGLPEDMAISESDLKHRPHGPPGGRGGPPGGGAPPLGKMGPPGAPPPGKMGPPEPGDQPRWMKEVEGAIALMINTCDDLEQPFINYLADQIGKPVWGVGPLLPEQFYKSAGSLLHDREMRTNRHNSNVTEDEVIQWLDSKPRGSVLYVSFGTEVGPTLEEYSQLADALEASNRPFAWVIQTGAGRPGPPGQLTGSSGPEEEGYFPTGLDGKVGNRGLIISGWAPQLLILSHQSTGGFLSHCGWNSILEAMGCGVPILAWPIRGDQHYNAKLVINHLKVGLMISDDPSKLIQRVDILNGVERLMGDQAIKKRAHMLRTIFDHGFPSSSVASLDAFRDLFIPKAI